MTDAQGKAERPQFIKFFAFVRYKDGSERYKPFSLPANKAEKWVREMSYRFNEAENIRAYMIGRELVHGHKSFAEDFDPDKLMDALKALGGSDF